MKSGIYKIVNLKNGKFYIGSTSDFDNRRRQHFGDLKASRHKNQYLQNAFNKYGKENFVFEVEFYCPEKDLLFHEQAYLDEHWDNQKYCYNISKESSSSFKGRKHTEKTIEKIRNIKTGIKHTEETKEKLRQIHLKIGSKPPSPRGRIHTAQEIKKRKKPVSQYDLDGNWINDWDSATDAIRQLEKKTTSCISENLKNRRFSAYGFIWRYKK